MRYIADNDLHIHSRLSLCSDDPEMTPQAILDYAVSNGLKNICLTDHFWDETCGTKTIPWYDIQNYAHITQSLPLPKADGVNFMFGCEVDMDMNTNIGINPANLDKFDFVIVPTTHLHMDGFTCRGDEDAAERAVIWAKRFDALLNADLPFNKMGVAHLTGSCIMREDYYKVIDHIPEDELVRLFTKAAVVGIGIELNFDSLAFESEAEKNAVLRPYRIAKQCGCKFYFGSDSHHPAKFTKSKANFENIIDLLGLEESDKFIIS